MSKLSRRRFLEDALWSAAATAIIGANRPARSAEGVQSTSLNERLSVAVLGVGKRGIDHAIAFASRNDTEVTVLCDADSELGQKRCDEVAAKSSRRPRFEQDLRKVLDDKTIDIVSIALPNHWHAVAAIWAMQAGKDVYLEKPVSHNVAEGRAILNAARKHQRICQTGTQHRSATGVREAMAYLHSGKLGEVMLARGLCYKNRTAIGPQGNYSIPPSVNYELWTGPAPLNPVRRRRFHYDWHWFWDYGNGEVGNHGVHQMDIARWGLGVDSLDCSVLSYGGRFGFHDAGETANTQVTVYDFDHKTLVFEVRGLATSALKEVRIGAIFEGTEGYLVCNSALGGGTVFDPRGAEVASFRGDGDHFDNFLQAVRSRKIENLNADIREGHLSSTLCHLANTSYRIGTPMSSAAALDQLSRISTADHVEATLDHTVAYLAENNIQIHGQTELQVGQLLKFDSHSENFLGNNQANALLTCEYRAPFIVPPGSG